MIFPLRPWLLGLLAVGYLWFTLINQLRPEWSSNPQYSYGWFVPLLCTGLVWMRWNQGKKDQPVDLPSLANQQSPAGSLPPRPLPRRLVLLLFAGCAFFFLPSRMLQAADPAWRLVDWLLALDVVALTLCGLYLAGGGTWLRRYAFPICLFLVAVPWLYPIEKWLTARLTFGVSTATVEVLGVLGLPAVARGKVIEIGTGVVGLDEACSGIRSFQSSLMISLFLGALYALPVWYRVLLVPIGFLLAFLFNVCRTCILTWIAARKGLAAIADYHDQAGVSILVACTAAMWLLTLVTRKQEASIEERAGTVQAKDPSSRSQSPPPSGLGASCPWSRSLALPLGALVAWLAVVEIAVAFWSHSGADAAGSAVRWSIAWPVDNSTFRQIEPDKESLKLLQYDEAQQVQWSEADGTTWTVFYLNWLPGRAGAYLAANRHSPEICMTYAGWDMRSGPERAVLEVKNLHLPFRCYSFTQGAKTLYVFHCRWEPAFETNPVLLEQQGQGSTLRGLRGLSVLWSGKGKGGQKIVEIIVQGCETADGAQAALVRQLEKLVKVEERTTDHVRTNNSKGL